MTEQYSNNMFAEKIRIAMIKSGNLKMSGLAALTDMSSSNAANKLRRNNFSEAEMRKMADALGYDVDIALVSRETGERI